MSSDKRLILCIILSAGCFIGVQSLMVQTGLIKPPPAAKKAPLQPLVPDQDLADAGQADGMVDGLPADPFLAEPESTPAVVAAPDRGRPRFTDLVDIGAVNVDDSKDPYLLRLTLDPRDASVLRATSSRYDAEFDPINRNKKPPRLSLIQPNPQAPNFPGSMAVLISPVIKGGRPVADGDNDGDTVIGDTKAEALMDWDVVRENDNPVPIRSITRGKVRGQEVRFVAKLEQPDVEVTKTIRIWEGEEGFEVDLAFKGGPKDGKFTYRMFGPHGIPIEGEWYTSTFRDVFFGTSKGKSTEIITRTAYDVHKSANDPAQRITQDPLIFAGVEDQYFATFLQPNPTPRTQDERWDASADAVVIKARAEDTTKADVAVVIESKPVQVGPNLGEVTHSYKVFAGPKTTASLAPYHAEELSSYRKNQWITIPFASMLAKSVIAPLLEKIYWVTQSVSRALGGQNGNYGVAIILLTMTVRLIMFPIGRKQAMMAKKMQDLQPQLVEVKERFKDDKEAIARETMAVYKRNKVNPAAGCLPALIQMPIFVGLWQCLNNSVELRQTSFLWIRDLAAPDMLFRFPLEVPLLGWFFNVLPFVVVSLMLIQTKLFSPPPTTPEAEAQQKMMKYMMIFMAFMFYKVPSGLGLYFITSSLWQISERLLLPKIIKTPPASATEVEVLPAGKGAPNGLPRGSQGKAGTTAAPSAQGWLGKRLEKLLEEAEKQKTIRNGDRPGDRTRPGSSSNGNGPRSKPPGKRR